MPAIQPPGLLRALFASALFAAPAFAQSGGIEIFAGETIFSHGTRVSLSHLYEERGTAYAGANETANPTDAEFTRHRLIAGYNYGLNARVTLGALVPFIDPELQFDATGGRASLGESGLGDTSLFGKYRLYTKDAYRRSFNVSFIGGMEVPTGQTGSVGPTPGDGSWDPFGAFAITESIGRWRFDGLLLYKWNTEGNRGVEFGDELSLGASMAYRYWHKPYPGPSHSARIGLLYQDIQSDRRSGSSLANTGSERLFLRPALGFHPIPAIDLSINVDVPLYQRFDGTQLGFDFRTFVAFGFRF